MNHGLDTDEQVFFYEQDFYILSNFSAFAVTIWGLTFPTVEHAYHWKKFAGVIDNIAELIYYSLSAHEAFTIAQNNKNFRRKDWDDIKVKMMESILVSKCIQHEYVRRKLTQTGNRELVENSWRDDFWGWGESKNGKNTLGKLWMKIRSFILNGGQLIKYNESN